MNRDVRSRRQVLGALSSTVAAGLAGCGFTDGSDQGESLETETMDTPARATDSATPKSEVTTSTSYEACMEPVGCLTFDDHIETGYKESPPRRVSEFMENTDGISVDPMATNLEDYIVDHSRRKYLEQTLEPGDQLSVIGSAVPRREDIESAAYPRDLVVTQTDETALQLSEQSYGNIADGGSALLVSALTSISGIALLILWAIL